MITESKLEILKSIPTNNCCGYAFLSAVIKSSYVSITDNVIVIDNLKFDNEVILKAIKNFYPNINIVETNTHLIISGKDVIVMLKDCYIVDNNDSELEIIGGFSEEFLYNDCCKETFLKTLYLRVGNLYYNQNSEEKSNGYSLEFVFKNYELADDTLALLNFLGLQFKTTKRKSNTIIYSKDSKVITDFFTYLKAINTVVQMQNNLVLREIRNDTNRAGNCFGANLNKTLNCSLEQVKAIEYLLKNYGIDYIDADLQEVCLIRLANPDISLNEMQKLYSKPISRAGLKYKLDKVVGIYKKIINRD